VGFHSTVLTLPKETTETELLRHIDEINRNSQIDGLIVQLPLPPHINEETVTQAVLPEKDVDGFHDINMGKLAKGHKGIKPATPYGIQLILDHYGIETDGKHVVVVGRSNIVGRPISIMLSENSSMGNATVTLCHSRTRDLREFTLNADILITALGKPGFITGKVIKPGAVVIDVGITRIEDPSKKAGWRLSGDVDFESASQVASALTPVPGGVGPMTIAGLLMNTYFAHQAAIQARTA
jgi:methylenetetrahydrofolate dehydrogenase (NADP+)/methenyltetrahydrofolate cyclohydrolase